MDFIVRFHWKMGEKRKGEEKEEARKRGKRRGRTGEGKGRGEKSALSVILSDIPLIVHFQGPNISHPVFCTSATQNLNVQGRKEKRVCPF